MNAPVTTTGVRAEPRRPGVRRRTSPRGALAAFLRGTAGAALLTLAFEVFARLELVDPRLLPPAGVILGEALRLLVDPAFLVEVWATLVAVLGGVALAAAIAVPLGVLIGSYRLAALGLTPIIDSLRSVPGIAIIPLLVLVMGQGVSMKVTIVAFVAVWPLLFNTVYGVRGVDPVAMETARAFRVPVHRTWWRVVLPSALPLVLTGLRLALATGLTVGIAAEIAVGTRDGVGYFILRASYAGFHADTVFAAVTLAGVLGYLMNGITVALTNRLVVWDGKGPS
ncbi:ABC transporter permease [Nonomuraea endophytica]|uniref:NitT/TauT family transport system permease protein n=1 Tax=Nonomuraea endophytica TaxID=714136 RepID=A0A7W8A650_9ACTN|nr:ABC transporter permease [Nonomuraea endophytica]MBB5078948.1 NitT/TauT family transport system permease protein [Nonomuraea endophytica]